MVVEFPAISVPLRGGPDLVFTIGAHRLAKESTIDTPNSLSDFRHHRVLFCHDALRMRTGIFSSIGASGGCSLFVGWDQHAVLNLCFQVEMMVEVTGRQVWTGDANVHDYLPCVRTGWHSGGKLGYHLRAI